MKGYIPISRGLFEHPFWCEERCYSRFEAWVYLIQDARFEDTKLYLTNTVFVVRRGQISVSLRYLAEAWGWSTKKVKHFLELLQKAKMITFETPKETGQTLITISKYDTYNGSNIDKETPKETIRKQQGNSEETNINKDNKENKENKEKKDAYASKEAVPPPFISEIENLSNEDLQPSSSEEHLTPPKDPRKKVAQKKESNAVTDNEICNKVVEYFNTNCLSLKPVKVLTDNRKVSILARFREYGNDTIFTVINNASSSKFLAGQNTKGWKADFDWIFKPTNFVKILEDKYCDGKGNTTASVVVSRNYNEQIF